MGLRARSRIVGRGNEVWKMLGPACECERASARELQERSPSGLNGVTQRCDACPKLLNRSGLAYVDVCDLRYSFWPRACCQNCVIPAVDGVVQVRGSRLEI